MFTIWVFYFHKNNKAVEMSSNYYYMCCVFRTKNLVSMSVQISVTETVYLHTRCLLYHWKGAYPN